MCITLTYLDDQLTGMDLKEIEAAKKSTNKNAMVKVHFDPCRLASEKQIMNEVCKELTKHFGCDVMNDSVIVELKSCIVQDSSTKSEKKGITSITFQIYW